MAKQTALGANIVDILASSFQKTDIFFSQSRLTDAKFHRNNPLISIVALGGIVLCFVLIPTELSSQEGECIKEVLQTIVS